MVLACFVGLMSCLEVVFETFVVAALEMVVCKGMTLDDVVVLEETDLEDTVLGLGGVALDGVVLGLGGVFFGVTGFGFFGSIPCSGEDDLAFVLVGLVLVVAGRAGFFLSVTPTVFLGMLRGVGFVEVGLGVF